MGIAICYVLVAILAGNAFSTRQNVLVLRMCGIALKLVVAKINVENGGRGP